MTFHQQCWLKLWCLGCLLLVATGGMAAITVTRQGNQLLIDGKPTALTFARGPVDVRDLPLYQEFGFNTLIVTIDSPGSIALDAADALITAAESRGLLILVEFANGDWSSEQFADPDSEDYRNNCSYFLETVTTRLRGHPNLVGWVISTVDERRFISDPGSLVEFLQARYPSIEALKEAWAEKDEDGRVKNALRFNSWTAIQQCTSPTELYRMSGSKVVRAHMTEDVTAYQELLHASKNSFRRYLQARYPTLDDLKFAWQCFEKDWSFNAWDELTIDAVRRRERSRPGSSPTSLLDLARYRATLSPMLLDWWAKEIARHDSQRRVFAGAQYSYRTLSTLPHSVDGALTECYPGLAEPDTTGQNSHAIDIARHGNQFVVLAGVLARNVQPGNLANALYAAAVHGAAGVCVTDWSALVASLNDTLPMTSARIVRSSLVDFAQRKLLGRAPAPTVALVYTPYVAGAHIQKRGLYGYMDYTPLLGGPGTPGSIFFHLRAGTSFGQFDYLSGDDLARVPLERYQTILLPSALDIPMPAQKCLFNFVRNGGTVVADIGAGTVQAAGDFVMLPEVFMHLFHVVSIPGIHSVRLNLEMDQPNTRFLHLLPGTRTDGMNTGFMITQIAKITPMEGVQYLFTTAANTKHPRPTVKPMRPMPLTPTYGMFSYRLGKGIAVYAPFPLYKHWVPGNRLFSEFHYDLFRMNAAVSLQRPIDFFPLLAEVARYDDGSILAWTKDETRPEVTVANPARRLYAVPGGNGYCTLTPESTILRFTTSGAQVAEPLPITVAASPLTINLKVDDTNPYALEFDIDAPGAHDNQPVLLTLGSGRYAITPGSKHFVTVNERTTLVTANAQGALLLRLHASRCHLRVGVTAPNGGKEVIFEVMSPDEEPVFEARPPDETAPVTSNDMAKRAP